DDWARLLSRVQSGDFPLKPLDLRPHGGGRQLGDPTRDCAARIIAGWLEGRPAGACPQREPPDVKRFAEVVQPGLEALECQHCHAKGAGGFTFKAAPATGAEL